MTEPSRQVRALLIIEQCNPQWSSVPLVGYKLYAHIKDLAAVTLVTHVRNEDAVRNLHPDDDIIIVREGALGALWHRIATRLSTLRGKTIWPLYHALTYPTYAEFDRKVLRTVGPRVRAGEFDVVHAITPMMPRYPFSIHKACAATPFVIGPVNGGVPYPKSFSKIARSEFSFLNGLRAVGRWLLPGYRQSYESADYVFSGSTYTKVLLEDLFDLKRDVDLLAENGLDANFFPEHPAEDVRGAPEKLSVLFVGRLVAYKGADLVVAAIASLPDELRSRVELTIVGDGPERPSLEQQAKAHRLSDRVRFTGWVQHRETADYYRSSDVFCFPSIREFGGAVVLEAMANNLPCIVVNNGGIAEYVTEATGFRIDPASNESVVADVASALRTLIEQPQLRRDMAIAAGQRARDYTWAGKAHRIVAVYRSLLAAQRRHDEPLSEMRA